MKVLIGLLTVFGFFAVTHAHAFSLPTPTPPPRCKPPLICAPTPTPAPKPTPTPAPTPTVLTGVFTYSITWENGSLQTWVASGTQTVTGATDQDLYIQALVGTNCLWWTDVNFYNGIGGSWTIVPMSYSLVDVTTGETLSTMNCTNPLADCYSWTAPGL